MPRWRTVMVALPALATMISCTAAAANDRYTTQSTRAPAVQAPARPSATPVATDAVDIRSFAFNPPAVTVPVGSTVTWTNDDVEQHTITARDRSFNSDAVNNDKSFAFTFEKPGSFNYFCQIHPQMVGLVVVTNP